MPDGPEKKKVLEKERIIHECIHIPMSELDAKGNRTERCNYFRQAIVTLKNLLSFREATSMSSCPMPLSPGPHMIRNEQWQQALLSDEDFAHDPRGVLEVNMVELL